MVVVAAMMVAGTLAGCSSLGPESSWSGNTGDLSGTVRSDVGGALPGVQVCLCAEENGDAIFQVTTDAAGEYRITGVELPGAHTFAETFWVCMNRTPGDATRIQQNYSMYAGEVTVEKDTTVTLDVTLTEVVAPPSQYVEH
jgi:hypothetical protein